MADAYLKNNSINTLLLLTYILVNEVCSLGVLVTADLTWSAHIQSIVQKARRKLGYMYRTFYKNCMY